MSETTRTTINKERLLTTTAAARLLGLTGGSLCTIRHYGNGPVCIRKGRRVWYPLSNVIRYAAERDIELDLPADWTN